MDGEAGAVQRTIDSVVRTGNEATQAGATSGRNDEGVATAPPRSADRGADEAIVRRSRTASGPPVAVRAAEVAVLQRWLARVWPAVALGDSGVGGFGVTEVIGGELLRPALAAVTGLLLASAPTLSASADPRLAGRQGVDATRSAPNPAPVPVGVGGKSLLYLILMAGLLALLAFTVWREFRVALHSH